MPPKIYTMEQGSDEWDAVRLGKITASVAKNLVTSKGAICDNKTVADMALTMAAQRMNGFGEEHVMSRDMARGHLQEPVARDAYAANYNHVDEVGFVERVIDGTILGASPDGLVGDDGGIEIKSRLGKFQIQTILADKVPTEYMMQIQFSLLVTERKWWDFVQYSNGMALYVQRVEPNLDMHGTIIEAVTKFDERVANICADYKSKADKLVQTNYISLDVLRERDDELEEAGL